MPPAHGALLVSLILGDEQLRANWQVELEEVDCELNPCVHCLLMVLIKMPGMDFNHIKQQQGMFSSWVLPLIS